MKGFKRCIVKLIPNNLKESIQYFFSFRYKKKFKSFKEKKKIIYMLTPIHGNMGDQAIAFATNKYLKENFSDYEVIEVYKIDTYRYIKAIKKTLNKDDFILLHGGGNMGNLYISEEKYRRFIINKFKGYKIISMTQTFSFTGDIEGEKELNNTKKIYNNHKDLTIIAREKYSYENMKAHLNSNIILNPDIVFYLSNMYKFQKDKRTSIMTCLRNDKESILKSHKDTFIKELLENYNDVLIYDTVIGDTISINTRADKLKDIFNKFLNSKVVITDRLHGMVFAAITKTPCIVTKSLDHKVTGTYEWIKDLNYIALVNNLSFENVKEEIDRIISLEKIDEIDFHSNYFSNLTDILKEIVI